MLLTISTTHTPARDLGYLFAKNPERTQRFELSYGVAHVFYPEATESRCTVALLLDLDPVTLVRGRSTAHQSDGTLAQYVNDRPYAANSFLSVAIAQVFASAMKGVSKGRQELADLPIPLEAKIPSISCRAGDGLLRGLFEPLGYDVEIRSLPLDDTFPEWGQSHLYELALRGHVRLADLLTHLYVLIPVLDKQKHYYVGDDEVEKLIQKGGDWLNAHPLRETIVKRYLKNRSNLYRDALERLARQESPDLDSQDEIKEAEEEVLERTLSLHELRIATVVGALKEHGANRVVDLGCGEGKLIRELLKDSAFQKIIGVDVCHRSLEIAEERLKLERMHEIRRNRIELIQSSVTYRDARFSDCDAACAIEVIEHIDPSRLAAFERVVFEFAKPPFVILTTPNADYNVLFPTLPAGQFRHRDHRFEWTRCQFRDWCHGVAEGHGYTVAISMIGPEDSEVGAPSQMAVFQR